MAEDGMGEAGCFVFKTLPQMLQELHGDLCAFLFMFTEVRCVAEISTTSKAFRDCIWSNSVFWRAYVGPCLLQDPMRSPSRGRVVDDVPRERSTMAAPELRDAFRKWLFHLDGDWVRDFCRFRDVAAKTGFGINFHQVLSDACYMVSGLMPSDDRRLLEAFVKNLTWLFGEYNVIQLDERGEAEKLVSIIQRRSDVFSEAQANMIAVAFDMSLDRIDVDYLLEDLAAVHESFFCGGPDSSDGEQSTDDQSSDFDQDIHSLEREFSTAWSESDAGAETAALHALR